MSITWLIVSTVWAVLPGSLSMYSAMGSLAVFRALLAANLAVTF
jgi:hypothetical protein